jgi:tetratricopeptide (TPR) repeat protein
MPSIEYALRTAVAHQHAGHLPQAEEICRRILAQTPRHAQALQLLGVIELLAGRHADAIDTLSRAVAIEPRRATLQNDLGEALRADGQFDQARACYKRSIQLNPNLAKTHLNLGRVLLIKVDHAKAIHEFRRAIELEPDNFDAHHILGTALLSLGDFEQGWREYAWRTHAPIHPSNRRTAPRWDGSPLEGKQLQVYAEQGLGDTLQFIRYLPLIAHRVGQIEAVVQPELIPLLADSGFGKLVPDSAPAGPCDAQIPLLDLPRLLGTTLETVPADVPYLRADRGLVERWRERLGKAFKVGIAWQGNKHYYLDRYRSIPLAQFEPLAKVSGVRLISLQVGDAANRIDELAGRFAVTRLDDWDTEHVTLMDTAAVMMNLDLVVTSDTVIAHLAGALGLPVWVAVCASPDWRWMLERADSPWYPTMRLFRQSRIGQWSGVFATIADALTRRQQG